MKTEIQILGDYSILMNDFYNHVIQNNELRIIVNDLLMRKLNKRVTD